MNEETDGSDKIPEFFLEKDGITKKPEFSENLVRTDNKPEKKESPKKTTGVDMRFKVNRGLKNLKNFKTKILLKFGEFQNKYSKFLKNFGDFSKY